MANHTPHKAHRTHAEEAEDDPEPGMLPIDPNDGAIPPALVEHPEQDRPVDPEV